MFSLKSSFQCGALAVAGASLLLAALPSGWGLYGSKPQEYDRSVDPATVYNGQASTYLKSKPGIETSGFGTLSQGFSAAQYAGKRVRFSANVKSDSVEPHGTPTAWAGLWMRVDAASKMLVLDNMHDFGEDRSIKGTTEWKNYAVVLDVPEGATGIFVGILLHGSGAIWINGGKFEVVGPEVAVTAGTPPVKPLPDTPANLGFEK